ncbi:MAG: TlpA family protein disulfide reductase, partial [Gammaproteobacteria bacterium]|nr:TlpA family protein disulfide reductase [Gammaproteobacteria bacterium]
MKLLHPVIRPLNISFVVLLVLSICHISYASDIKPGDNQPMPNIHWQDADEKTHQLNDTNGKPRLLHFWAAWCFPCREELPDMLEWKKKNSDIVMIPLSLDERMAQAKY